MATGSRTLLSRTPGMAWLPLRPGAALAASGWIVGGIVFVVLGPQPQLYLTAALLFTLVAAVVTFIRCAWWHAVGRRRVGWDGSGLVLGRVLGGPRVVPPDLVRRIDVVFGDARPEWERGAFLPRIEVRDAAGDVVARSGGLLLAEADLERQAAVLTEFCAGHGIDVRLRD